MGRRMFFALFFLLIAAVSHAATIEKITGKIDSPEAALDGDTETFSVLKKVSPAAMFETILYLDGELLVDGIEIDALPAPASISVSGSMDIVSWREMSLITEWSGKDKSGRVTIKIPGPEYSKYIKIKMDSPGIEEIKIAEIRASFVEALKNRAFDIKAEPVDDYSMKITYKTEYPAQTQVRYGLDRDNFDKVSLVRERVTEHTVNIDNLLAGTQYYYQILLDRLEEMTPVMDFRTTGDPLPFIRKVNMADPGPDSAVIELEANKPVTWRLLVGNYSPGLTVQDIIDKKVDSLEVTSEKQAQAIRLPLEKLVSRKRYFFVVSIQDAAGNLYQTDLLGFDTAPVNLALNAPVEGTFTVEMDDKNIVATGKPLARVTDGDVNFFTGFAKSGKPKQEAQWVSVDMGKVSQVAEVIVVWSNLAVPDDYKVLVSKDAKEWDAILDLKKGDYPDAVKPVEKWSPRGDPLTEITLNADREMRYIKIEIPKGAVITSRFGWRFAILAEIKALAPEGE